MREYVIKKMPLWFEFEMGESNLVYQAKLYFWHGFDKLLFFLLLSRPINWIQSGERLLLDKGGSRFYPKKCETMLI